MRALQMLMAGLLVFSVGACGNKGKLKSPAQIQVQEEKKARKAAGKEVKEKKVEKQPVNQESSVGIIVAPSNQVAQ